METRLFAFFCCPNLEPYIMQLLYINAKVGWDANEEHQVCKGDKQMMSCEVLIHVGVIERMFG